MRVLGVFVAAALALGAADGADAAKAAKKAAKKGGYTGTVIDLKRPNAGKSVGSITIKIAAKKKDAAAQGRRTCSNT